MGFAVVILVLVILAVWRPWAPRGSGGGALLRGKPCRWVLLDDRNSLMEFRCETCKVTAYSQSRHGPAECKKQLRNSL